MACAIGVNCIFCDRGDGPGECGDRIARGDSMATPVGCGRRVPEAGEAGGEVDATGGLDGEAGATNEIVTSGSNETPRASRGGDRGRACSICFESPREKALYVRSPPSRARNAKRRRAHAPSRALRRY